MKTTSTFVLALISFGMISEAIALPEPEATYVNGEVDKQVAPVSKQSRSMITTSTLEEVITSMQNNQDFSSYNEVDFRAAKEWFLDPENHPNDGKEQDLHYMKERLTMRLLYSANCKEGCKLKYAYKGWLVKASDHCQWHGVTCNSENEIKKLNLRKQGLSQSFTLFELDHLRILNLNLNNLSGDFVVAGGTSFAMEALQKLTVSRNQLTGFSGLQLLTKLKNLHLYWNMLEDEFNISKESLPQSIQWLNLKRNNLTKINGVEFLTKLKGLYLSDNNFEGEFSITKEHFPLSLQSIGLNSNAALTSLNIDDDAVPSLRKVFLIGTNFLPVNKGLCDRNILVTPSEICPCENVDSYTTDGSDLGDIIESMVSEQDFSSYCQRDFDVAKKWFLNMANHPTDGKQNNENYMKERFTLALIYSANCKEKCTLGSTFSWLTPKDHCNTNWGGIRCYEETKEIKNIHLSKTALSGSFTMFGLTSLETIYLSSNNLSGTFTVVGDSPNLSRIYLDRNSVERIVGAGMLTNLSHFYLTYNGFVGDFVITEDNFPTSIYWLDLSGNKLTGFVNKGSFPNLQSLFLNNNQLAGNLNLANFPMSIRELELNGNQLTGLVGGKFLSNLGVLYLDKNEFEGDFIVDEENFPTSISELHLSKNKLTGFVDGKILTNLGYLDLDGNEFAGTLNVTTDNFPLNIGSLNLAKNNLEGFAGGSILTKLWWIGLFNNDIKGDLVIKKDDYPNSLGVLNLRGNRGLKSVDADSDAVPNLRHLVLNYIDGIIVKEELCNRDSIDIGYSHENVCGN